MKSAPGSYILVLQNGRRQKLQIGSRGILEFYPGYYLYTGSAFGPGGMRARVARHCREQKSRRWHIDYLRESTQLDFVWYSHDPERLEHRWAQALEGLDDTESVIGFGCSDCHCLSHLFFVATEQSLRRCRRQLEGRIDKWYQRQE